MATAHGFEIVPGGQGAIFALSGNGRRNRRQIFGHWEAELRKDHAYVCIRRQSVANPKQHLDEVTKEAHSVAQTLLDIVAVEERNALLIIEPYNNVVWRTGPHGLKLQLTTGITFKAESQFKAIVTNGLGQVLPDPPYMPPQHHYAYRYFRYSQTAQNVFDSYRNMFLAFESLLDYVEERQPTEGETDWLKRVLAESQARGLNLMAFAKPGSANVVEDFLDKHYSAVRCAAFHSKSSSGDALRPGDLSHESAVLQQLLALQTLVEELLKSLFSVRLMSSGFYHSGFGHLLSQLAPATGLLFSVADCPTVEQLMAEEENVAPGEFSPVTLKGAHGSATDEWLFVSEVKPEKLPIAKIASLRLIAKPNDHMFLGQIAAKMNRTLMTTDLDLAGISKLVFRVRCILRNVQAPKRGFSQ